MDLPGKYHIREDPLYMPFNHFWEISCPTIKIDSTALLETVLENWIYLNIIILGHVLGLLAGIQCRGMRSTANQLLNPLKFRSISSSQPCRQSRQTYATYDKIISTHTCTVYI